METMKSDPASRRREEPSAKMRLSRKLQLVLAGAVAALFCIVIGVVWLATTMKALDAGRQLADSRVKEIGLSVRALSGRRSSSSVYAICSGKYPHFSIFPG